MNLQHLHGGSYKKGREKITKTRCLIINKYKHIKLLFQISLVLDGGFRISNQRSNGGISHKEEDLVGPSDTTINNQSFPSVKSAPIKGPP